VADDSWCSFGGCAGAGDDHAGGRRSRCPTADWQSPVGTFMASLNSPPVGAVATAMVGHARPLGSTEVEM